LLLSVHVGSVWLDSKETIKDSRERWVDCVNTKELGGESSASLVLLEEDLKVISVLVARELNLLESLLVVHLG